MGYSLSRKSVIRVQPYLDRMLETRENHIFQTEDPADLAYLINQAIVSAVKKIKLGDELKKYANLHGLYRFKKRDGELLAEFRQLSIEEIEQKKEEAISKARETISQAADRHTVETALDLIDVMATLISLKDADEIYFPNAVLDNDSKIRLYGWTREVENLGWQMIDQKDRGIIITKLDVPKEVLYTLPLSGEENV